MWQIHPSSTVHSDSLREGWGQCPRGSQHVKRQLPCTFGGLCGPMERAAFLQDWQRFLWASAPRLPWTDSDSWLTTAQGLPKTFHSFPGPVGCRRKSQLWNERWAFWEMGQPPHILAAQLPFLTDESNKASSASPRKSPGKSQQSQTRRRLGKSHRPPLSFPTLTCRHRITLGSNFLMKI